MPERLARIWNWSNAAAWILLVVLLPISSLPFVARLSSADSVAPASAIPLLWLVVFWLIPHFLRGGKLPAVGKGLVALSAVAVLATIAANFYALPTYKDTSPLRHEMVSLLTLAVGVCFFFVVSTFPKDTRQMGLTLQLLNWSGLVMLLWSLLQAYLWYRQGGIPDWMQQFQSQISLGGFYIKRVTGFAFEPSWQGHQLNMVYLPVWLAATIRRYSAHKFRLGWFSFENVLFVMGLAVLVLASRVGLLSVLLVAAYLVYKGTQLGVSRVQSAIHSRISQRLASGLIVRILLPVVLGLAFLLVYLSAAFGLVYVASRNDPRLARIFDPSIASMNIYSYANQLAFAERVVYWGTGWEVFNDHPFLGVGIGNTGYYFPEKMPAYGWSLTEVNTSMFRAGFIPNTKSLWVRWLSETGIIGFVFWLAWLYLLWQAGRFLRRSDQPMLYTIGLAGTLALIALLAEGFSVDSFALPYIWFSFGFLGAGSGLYVKQAAEIERLPSTTKPGIFKKSTGEAS